MADRIADLYRAGRLSEQGLDRAVERGWIDADAADALRAEQGD